jgi:hypothetical protein
MKIKVTVMWAQTLEIEVDKKILYDLSDTTLREKVIAQYRIAAINQAAENINWKDGIITDCEDFPDLIE